MMARGHRRALLSQASLVWAVSQPDAFDEEAWIESGTLSAIDHRRTDDLPPDLEEAVNAKLRDIAANGGKFRV